MKSVATTTILILQVALAQDGSARLVESEHFAVAIPDEWVVVAGDNALLTARSPRDHATDTFLENIRICRYPLRNAKSVDDALAAQKANLENRFKLLSDGVIEGKNTRVAWLAITPRTASPDNLVMIDYLMIREGQLYVIHAMAAPDVMQQYQPQFEDIASSVTFFESAAATDSKLSRETSPHESGRRIGRLTVYVMLFVVVTFGIVVAWRSKRRRDFARNG